MVLHGVADGTNMRPMRAHRRIAPQAKVLRGPAGLT